MLLVAEHCLQHWAAMMSLHKPLVAGEADSQLTFNHAHLATGHPAFCHRMLAAVCTALENGEPVPKICSDCLYTCNNLSPRLDDHVSLLQQDVFSRAAPALPRVGRTWRPTRRPRLTALLQDMWPNQRLAWRTRVTRRRAHSSSPTTAMRNAAVPDRTCHS